MRRVTYKNKSIVFNERDYKTLLRRFDPKAIEECYKGWNIESPCICKFYFVCNGCPVRKFGGCTQALRYILKVHTSLSFWSDYVTTIGLTKRDFTREIQRIRNILLRATWVGGREKKKP